MVEEGLEAEVKHVYEQRGSLSRIPLQAVGYKEFFPYFAGQISLEEAVDKVKQNTRRFAKRQLTWFRNRMADYVWIDPFNSNIITAFEQISV